MKVVNLYGGPGTGKSTIAASVFSELKIAGYNAEIAMEYAKDKVWEKHPKVLKCQPYIFGKQLWRLERLRGEVEIVVTDAPLLHSLFYASDDKSGFMNCVLEYYDEFDNLDIFLRRSPEHHAYNPKGRYQTEEEAKKVDQSIHAILSLHCKNYHEVYLDGGIHKAVSNILSLISSERRVFDI